MEVFMVEMTDIGIDNAVAFRMWGKVTESDMASVFSDAKEKINRYGKIEIGKRWRQMDLIDKFKKGIGDSRKGNWGRTKLTH
jgi:hypothetical protein